MFAHNCFMMVNNGVLNAAKIDRVAVGKTSGPLGRRASSGTRHRSLHIAVVSFLRNISRLDHTVAVHLEQVDYASDKVRLGAKEFDARPIVGAANCDLGEFYLARLGVELERSDAHIALQLNEPVAVRIAAYVQPIQVTVLDNGAIEVQLLSVRQHLIVIVLAVVSAEQNAARLHRSEYEADVFEERTFVVVEIVVDENVGRATERDGRGRRRRWRCRCAHDRWLCWRRRRRSIDNLLTTLPPLARHHLIVDDVTFVQHDGANAAHKARLTSEAKAGAVVSADAHPAHHHTVTTRQRIINGLFVSVVRVQPAQYLFLLVMLNVKLVNAASVHSNSADLMPLVHSIDACGRVQKAVGHFDANVVVRVVHQYYELTARLSCLKFDDKRVQRQSGTHCEVNFCVVAAKRNVLGVGQTVQIDQMGLCVGVGAWGRVDN
ncbi:hypothetical protein BpHYR1_039695 [Brachionus plicatilis]|uniref:Uncharacterized protein n=1 Tax=Brachionus plicatilis TaxID=10195 RepID=A0A3M7QCY3_BRAPC|nr:hypothetical protein BpHYR1_039695 [Brachionus plicatilis]